MELPNQIDPETAKYLEDNGWSRLVTTALRWRHEDYPGRIFQTDQAVEAQKQRETKK